MAFRNVIISSRCKLDYSLNYMICHKGLEETRISLDEIKMVVINSTQVSITSTLISECLKKKIKIMITDDKHNPSGEIIPYKNNYYAYRHLNEQIDFKDEFKKTLWKRIIQEKISNQAKNLEYANAMDAYYKLKSYITEVENGDASNREGHAAKVYFNALFGEDFCRNDESNEINMFLNYGYSFVLATINRIIRCLGYYTELGIHHIGETNTFNLSCDFVEPLRPLVDSLVVKNQINVFNFKDVIKALVETNVQYRGRSTSLDIAIEEYVESMINFLKTGDHSKIEFIGYEL